MEQEEILIVSYGGGTNSTAMLIGMAEKGIIPHHILFADTGGEQEHTYAFIKLFNKWLSKHGMPEIEVVRYRTKTGEEITLEQDILNNQTLPAIAFGWKTCSQKFKALPQQRFVKEKFTGRKVKWFIGFDASERHRSKPNPEENFVNVFPLIEWGWDRTKCIEIIRQSGLCLPGKSSCFFCPNMKKHEILSLSTDEKDRVKKIEANATKVAELKGLGRRFSWTDLIESDSMQNKLFDDLDIFQTPCECID